MALPLLIDTDPGCDDALAILLALEHADLDVVGLTTVHGNAPTSDTTENARKILELFDRQDVPIAAGSELPLLDPLETAEHIHGPNGIKGELPEPTETTEPVDAHGAQFIVDMAREYEGELTLAAVGRLTNVAIALSLEPALPDMLDQMLIMGGAAFVPGNVTPLAAANFYGDPHAARRVVRDTHPTVIPLDITEQGTLPAPWIGEIPRKSPRGESIYQWVTYYPQEILDRYGIETAAMHDAVAILSLVEDFVKTDEYYLEVAADHGHAHGALICDARGTSGNGPNAVLGTGLHVEAYQQCVIDLVEGVLQ